MAQQVVRALVNFLMKDTTVRKPTMDFVFEQRGSNTSVNPASIYTQLHTFFDVLTGAQTLAMTKYMSPAIDFSNNNCMHTRLYDITDKLSGTVPAGSPIDENFYKPTNVPSAGLQSLPLEVACALSYRSDYGTDPEFGQPTGNKKGRYRPRATHRGRVFFGPLIITSISNNANNAAAFTATFLSDAQIALSHLVQGPTGTSDVTQMVQWSRKAARVSPITKIDVNSDPDIRRRRGLRAATHQWT